MASDVDFGYWGDFALAIVEQAVTDYRAALTAYERSPNEEMAYVVKHFERFFLSEWCEELLQNKFAGSTIIERVKGEYNADI